MARKNVFNILREKINPSNEFSKIKKLYFDKIVIRRCNISSVVMSDDYISIEDQLMESGAFPLWNGRCSAVNCEDFRNEVGIYSRTLKTNYSQIEILNGLEFFSNMLMLADRTDQYNNEIYIATFNYKVLKDNISLLLENLSYEAKYLRDKDVIILVEKSPQATAAAEIVDAATANKIIEYNHFTMKGDLEGKRQVLLALSDKYDSMSKTISQINSQLNSDIGYMLNNYNIRHNNKEGKDAKSFIVEMDDDTLEEWYDETYQMLLLAFLLNDNIDRANKIKEQKAKG